MVPLCYKLHRVICRPRSRHTPWHCGRRRRSARSLELAPLSAAAPAARSARVSEHVRAQKGLRPRRGRCGKAQGWSDAGSGEGRFLVRLGIGLEWARAGVGPGLGLGLGLGYQG